VRGVAAEGLVGALRAEVARENPREPLIAYLLADDGVAEQAHLAKVISDGAEPLGTTERAVSRQRSLTRSSNSSSNNNNNTSSNSSSRSVRTPLPRLRTR
jgi:hypothetical protein